MNSNIETIFKKHQVWIDIVSSFGCNRETAEDIVMEMYIKIDKSIKKGLDIDYNKTDYNYYYIFKTLKSLFLDLKRKEKKVNIINIDEIQNKSFDEIINYTSSYSIIQKKLKKMYWYDRKIFEIIQGGESIAKLSRKTGIPYHSLYNTYKEVKKILKKLL
jgi:DNA-directed RNA polymerase specialized sigma24 family protein|tara:strand:+ start:108 stop:587 length:480 start_codon:yes stop_codon:yes gene_type:complete